MMSKTTSERKLKLQHAKEFPITQKGERVIITLYPISELAEALGRTTQTVRKWELNGVIPKASFRDKSNRRYYSQEQIELIVVTAEQQEIRQGESIDGTQFSKIVFDNWKAVTLQTLKNGKKASK